MERHFLVVPIYRLLRVDREWTSALASRAIRYLELLVGVLEEWTQRKTAFAAIELDVFELREDSGTPGDDARYPDKAVQIALSEITQRQGGGKLGDADVDLGMDPVVRWVVE